MKRQPYFPRTVDARPEWFGNFYRELPTANAILGLPAPGVTAIIADAKYLEYASGAWLTAVREFGPAATSALDGVFYGPGATPFVLPVFAAPALPAGVVAVGAEALTRVFEFVKIIKATPGYTESIGLQLGIVGAEDAASNPVPTFALKVEMGDDCQCVRINFKKYGHMGVQVWAKRGTGDWEMLAIDLQSPYLDARPLAVAGTPEVRQYRLRFYEDAGPVGDFTEVQSSTVGPV